ncbi:MAG: LPS translocon maturation chaperone LptM [Pseudomonadota bacterium]|uniref:LPS translocon maturation chaperone LptM n=1 Tax=Aquabacterium sp. TaxID=1872578 RepID=UPI003BAEF887
MNSQPKIVVTCAHRHAGNARPGDLGIAPTPPQQAWRAPRIAALSLCLTLLAACGQKGALYLPGNAPASHRHGAAPKAAPAAAPAPSSANAASSPTSSPTRP